MKTIIDNENKSDTGGVPQTGAAPRDRVRQDKFSTLHLPCFLSDLNKHLKD